MKSCRQLLSALEPHIGQIGNSDVVLFELSQELDEERDVTVANLVHMSLIAPEHLAAILDQAYTRPFMMLSRWQALLLTVHSAVSSSLLLSVENQKGT